MHVPIFIMNKSFIAFCGFFLGSNQDWGGGGVMVCVCFYIYREHPKAQPIVVLEKPGIEPVTPALQGITLTHYTKVASDCI